MEGWKKALIGGAVVSVAGLGAVLGFHFLTRLSPEEKALRARKQQERKVRSVQKMIQGDKLVQKKQFHDAIKKFRRAIALDRDNDTLVTKLATAQMTVGQYTEAEAALTDFLARYESVPCCLQRGMIRSKLNKLELALLDFEQVLQYEPDHAVAGQMSAQAGSELGHKFYSEQKFTQAIEHYSRVIHRGANVAPAVYAERALSYLSSNQPDLAVADAELLASSPLLQPKIQGLGILISVYEAMQQPVKVVEAFDRLQDIVPDHPVVTEYASAIDKLRAEHSLPAYSKRR